MSDFKGRFCNTDDKIKCELNIPGTNIFIVLYRIDSNNSRSTISLYHSTDENRGGQNSQYSGFFTREGIEHIDNQIFSFGKNLLLIDDTTVNVQKEEIYIKDRPEKYDISLYENQDNYQGSDDRIAVYKENGILKIVQPANDFNFVRDEYDNIVNNHKSQLIGEIMFVGSIGIWGFVLPNANSLSLENLLKNNKIYNEIYIFLVSVANEINNNGYNVKIPENPSIEFMLYMITSLFNYRSHGDMNLLKTILHMFYHDEIVHILINETIKGGDALPL